VKYYVSQTTTGCESDRALIDVVVNGTTAAPITCGTNTPTSVSFNWTAVSGATGYTVSHTINGGSAVNSGTITGTTHSVTGLNPSITNNVTITVTPVGVTCPVATSFTCQPSNCPTPVTNTISNIQSCPASSVNSIVFTSPEPAATFSWSNDNPAIGLAASGTGAIPSFTTASVTSTQTATISVQASYLTCVGPTKTFTITVNPTPATPGVTVVDLCDGTSELSTTATGTLLWSNGETSAKIVVTTGGTYTVTSTVNGCPSLPGSGLAAPKNKPSTPVITVVNNCNGTSTLSTTATGVLQWNTGESAATITVSNPGLYAVVSTINGCTSDLGSATAAPKTTPNAPTISSTAPTCAAAGTSAISNYDTNQSYTFNPLGPIVGTGGIITGMLVGTSYTVIATLSACPSVASDSFSNLAPIVAPNAPVVTTPINYCIADVASALTAVADVNHDLVWYTAATDGIGSATAPTPVTTVAGTTFYYVSQVNLTTGCESARIAITVTVSQVTIDLTANCIDTDYTLNATASAGATYQWYKGTTLLATTGSTLIATSPDTYRVAVTFNGCTTDATENVTSIYCEIPKGISPNNDGKNDSFDLTNFDVRKLQIYNRYGMEMYSKTNYTNEWDGFSNAGQNLPDGTYYYVIEFESGKTKTGWVYKNSEN
jgi:gliding motility-associated-like protein